MATIMTPGVTSRARLQWFAEKQHSPAHSEVHNGPVTKILYIYIYIYIYARARVCVFEPKYFPCKTCRCCFYTPSIQTGYKLPIRPPLWSRGNIVASHLAGPDSIPSRVSFCGWGFFRGFSSIVRQMSGKPRPHPSPDIIGHHNHSLWALKLI